MSDSLTFYHLLFIWKHFNFLSGLSYFQKCLNYLACITSNKKSVILNIVPLYIVCQNFLAALELFLFMNGLQQYIIKCHGWFYLLYLVWGLFSLLDQWVYSFIKFGKIPSIIKNFFSTYPLFWISKWHILHGLILSLMIIVSTRIFLSLLQFG